MSTLSKVDPNTLGWVKAEIDETLKQARHALESYTENTADEGKLRFCMTYLHQVLGTLQMVELDGAAMLARETEALAESVLSGKTAPTAPVIDTLIRGILTIPGEFGFFPLNVGLDLRAIRFSQVLQARR